jgi:hypothetical protein
MVYIAMSLCGKPDESNNLLLTFGDGRVLRGKCLVYQVFTCAGRLCPSSIRKTLAVCVTAVFNVAIVIAAAAGVNYKRNEVRGVDEDEITSRMMKRSKFLGIRPRQNVFGVLVSPHVVSLANRPRSVCGDPQPKVGDPRD